jgi:glycosyltransferase involved in cell wall biosynthesis
VLLEAMSASLPVVASAVGGVPEIVQPGVTGELVPASDAARLADAVSRLLGDEAALQRMGTVAREAAQERFSTRAWMDRLDRVYADALEERS